MIDDGSLRDGSEQTLRAALAQFVPQLAQVVLRINPTIPSPDPDWWAGSAVIDERYFVKFAWSAEKAAMHAREGILLDRLASVALKLPLPELVAFTEAPVLVVTKLLHGGPLTWEWQDRMTRHELDAVGEQIGSFLAQLHGLDAGLLGGLAEQTLATPAGTTLLRERFTRLVDNRRGKRVLNQCDWIDSVLTSEPDPTPGVVVHGDFHSYNQIWDWSLTKLMAVLDFRDCYRG